MRRFFLQDIEFPRLPLVLLLGELRICLAFCLEYIALPGLVTSILPVKRAIQLGGMLLAFLIMLVFGLEALFFLGSLSSSEAAKFALVMLSVVSACSQCSTNVSGSTVSGLKP